MKLSFWIRVALLSVLLGSVAAPMKVVAQDTPPPEVSSEEADPVLGENAYTIRVIDHRQEYKLRTTGNAALGSNPDDCQSKFDSETQETVFMCPPSEDGRTWVIRNNQGSFFMVGVITDHEEIWLRIPGYWRFLPFVVI